MDLLCLDPSAPDFPSRLRDIPDPPERLWVRGNPRTLSRTSVAIVGSRRASPGSLDIAHRMASDLARIGVTIVSGLARGCDGAAHRGALDAGGITIAVLGSGPDVIYPPEHHALAEQVALQGAILSEFAPGALPLPHHFRQRNRLISGLAHGVIVIEANDKSGSLITAGCALAQGREVMVVPGTVLAGRNRGGHQLIRDGAALVENAEDVLAVLVNAVPLLRASTASAPPAAQGRAPRTSEASAPPVGVADAPDDPVLATLDPAEPQDFDQLARRTGLSGQPLLARLAELELSGQIARYPGGRFVRCSGKVIT
ncbi:MAG: DNA-protecting protein DprA [Vicinamibacteria bacterium]|nr:DNA-protecting protein DprA [Vicinamibacteria bacterium]